MARRRSQSIRAGKTNAWATAGVVAITRRSGRPVDDGQGSSDLHARPAGGRGAPRAPLHGRVAGVGGTATLARIRRFRRVLRASTGCDGRFADDGGDVAIYDVASDGSRSRRRRSATARKATRARRRELPVRFRLLIRSVNHALRCAAAARRSKRRAKTAPCSRRRRRRARSSARSRALRSSTFPRAWRRSALPTASATPAQRRRRNKRLASSFPLPSMPATPSLRA